MFISFGKLEKRKCLTIFDVQYHDELNKTDRDMIAKLKHHNILFWDQYKYYMEGNGFIGISLNEIYELFGFKLELIIDSIYFQDIARFLSKYNTVYFLDSNKHIHKYHNKYRFYKKSTSFAEIAQNRIENIIETVDNDEYMMSIRHYEEITDMFINNIKHAMCYVDVGAEFGYYGYLAHKYMDKDAEIHLIEADPRRMDYLHKYFDKIDNFIFHQVAISNEIGTRDLHIDEVMASPSLINHSRYNNQISVPTNTLDTMFGDRDIDILKMDIEGGEILAFQGMRHIMAKKKTKIFLELHHPVMTETESSDLIDLIRSYHYTWYFCSGLLLKRIEAVDCKKYNRVYLVPGGMDPC